MALAIGSSCASVSVKLWGDGGNMIRLIITLFVSAVPLILRLDIVSAVGKSYFSNGF